MATYFARASGNINGAIWATTPTGTAATATFTASDVLCANGISTITINVDTTVSQIRNDAFNDGVNTATAGGAFSLASGVTLTADLICQNTLLMTISAAGTYTISGSLSSTGTAACVAQVNGTVNITGSLSAAGAAGIGTALSFGPNAVALNITGNVTGGTGGGGLYIPGGSGTVNITGDVTGGTTSAGVNFNTGSASVTITGTVTGGSGSAAGVKADAGTSPTITINGTAVGGVGGVGLQAGSVGTYSVTRAKASSSQAGVAGGTGVGVSVTEIEYGDNGLSPTTGIIRFAASTSNIALVQMVGGSTAATKKTLVDPISTGFYPAIGDVRSGTSYAGGTRTGTLAVPAASLVAAGVSVDNTTGTAAITSAAIQSACDSAIAAFSSGRLANVATTATTGQQIADATF